MLAETLEKNKGALFQIKFNGIHKKIPQLQRTLPQKAAFLFLNNKLSQILKAKEWVLNSVHPGPIATEYGSRCGFNTLLPAHCCLWRYCGHALKIGIFIYFQSAMAKTIWRRLSSFQISVMAIYQK